MTLPTDIRVVRARAADDGTITIEYLEGAGTGDRRRGEASAVGKCARIPAADAGGIDLADLAAVGTLLAKILTVRAPTPIPRPNAVS
ncbi:MAG TPA: hypothetical protein VE261_07120 [Gaiellaceae bacterium]|nr:hypothetical protein [Gaiellaceae bacterium]